MTTLRNVILIALVAALFAPAALPAASAAAPANAVPQPEPGPLSPAFVRALQDPLVTVGLGRMPSPVEVEVDAADTARRASALPSAFSLVDPAVGKVTPVRNQLEYGTCWAFANVAALESSLMPADPAPDFSEDNLVARSGYGPFPEATDRYTYGGYDFMAVAYFARWAGPVAEADDPYTYPASRGHVSGPVRKHVQGVVMIPGRNHPLDNDLIKHLVHQYGGVSVGMYWDPSAYEGPWEVDDPPAPATYFFGLKNWGENHGVVVVGWDDAYPADRFQGAYGKPEGPGAFLARNSYGSGFGEGGYFWVSYYDAAFAREQRLGGYGGGVAYSVVEDPDNYARVYQYDKLGVTDRWGYGISRVWGANRFTAAKTQRIAAAGFYTLASGTRYQVWAGSSFRTLRLRASGTTALPGFTTVPFSTKLRVKARKRFIVAVKLVSPGTTHPMAIEWPTKSWMAGATARAGQSYLSRNGSSWTDATRVRRGSSVCIKAFAQ